MYVFVQEFGSYYGDCLVIKIHGKMHKYETITIRVSFFL